MLADILDDFGSGIESGFENFSGSPGSDRLGATVPKSTEGRHKGGVVQHWGRNTSVVGNRFTNVREANSDRKVVGDVVATLANQRVTGEELRVNIHPNLVTVSQTDLL